MFTGCFALFLLLLNATLQEFTGEQIAKGLGSALKTQVRIEGFRFKPLRRIEIGQLYIEDHYGDTLILADSLQLGFAGLPFFSNVLDIRKLEIGRIDARIRRKAYEATFNYDFLLRFLSADQTDTSDTAAPLRFKLDGLVLHDGALLWQDDTHSPKIDGFDPAHWQVENIHLAINSINASADSLSMHLQNLAFMESSGLAVQEITTRLAILPDGMRFDALQFKSTNSSAQASIKFHYGNIDDLDDFFNRVRIDARIRKMSLGTSDLRWLLGSQAPNASLYAEGAITGKLSRLKTKRLTLRFGQHTFIKGDLSITGLPEYREALYDLQFDEAFFDWPEITTALRIDSLPPQLQGLRYLSMRGNAFGYPSDFVAQGTFETNLGEIRSDLNVKLHPVSSSYKGLLVLRDFHLAELTGDSSLGWISLETNLAGKGNNWEAFEGQLEGHVDYVDYAGYRYQQLQLNGYLNRQSYSGSLSIADSNAQLRFFGMADLRGERPTFNFTAQIDTIQFQALGWTKDTLGLSGYAELCGEGNSLDNLLGELNFRLMRLGLNKRIIELDEINLLATSDARDPRVLSLRSPIGEMEIRGHFGWTTFPTLMEHYVMHYVRKAEQPLLTDSSQYFEAHADIWEAQKLADWLAPDKYSIGALKGHALFRAANNEMDLVLEAPVLRQNNWRIQNLQLLGSSNNDRLFIDVYADTLWYDNTLLAQQISLEQALRNDTLDFQVRAMGEEAYNDLQLDGQIDFSTANPSLQFAPSSISVYDNAWELQQNGHIVFNKTGMLIPDLQFQQGIQHVQLQGRIGKSQYDTLLLGMQNVDLQQLNPLLAVYKTSAEGYANVALQAQSVLGQTAVYGKVDISELVVDGQPLGDLGITSTYDVDRQQADLYAQLLTENDTLALISGTLGSPQDVNRVDLQARLNHSPIHPLEQLLAPTFSDVSGRATALLYLKGNWNQLALTGEAELENARTRVDFLNQYYNINKRVKFTPSSIEFDEAAITDDSGGKGSLSGRITHQSFRHTRLDLQLRAEDLLVLNTEPNFTDAYFGTGRLSGLATFTGPIDLVDIQIRAATERGTRFAIPLDAETNRANLDFITFVNKADTVQQVVEEKGFEVSGVNFGMNVTATPDAEFSIIFDRVAGDIIRGRGAGAIEFQMNPQGEIQMFGNYTFSGGDYSFTLANIPSKRFRISEGSTIQWTGDPYDATINLNAVYRQRANVLPLLTDAQRILVDRSSGRSRTYMNVDTYLKLTGSLLRPTINFEIKLPTVNENDASDVLVARIQNINNNEQELNNQVLGLLVAGQFIPTDNAPQATTFIGSTGANSLTEVLSNQLNAVLSQMFDNVNIGINYRSSNLGTVTDVTRNDITVALNTTLFNDRVRIDGNVGNTLQPGTTGNTSAQNLAGEVIVEYLITPDGNFRVKAFNKIDDRIIVNRESNYRQGVGVSYTENYNTTAELLEKPTRFIQDRLIRRIPWLPESWKGSF